MSRKSDVIRKIKLGEALVKVIKSPIGLVEKDSPSASVLWNKDWDFLMGQLVSSGDRPKHIAATARLDAQKDAGKFFVLNPLTREISTDEAQVKAYYDAMHGDKKVTGAQCMTFLPPDGNMNLFGNPFAYGLGILMDARRVNYHGERHIFSEDAFTFSAWPFNEESASGYAKNFPAKTVNTLRESMCSEEGVLEYNEVNGGITSEAIMAVMIHPPTKVAAAPSVTGEDQGSQKEKALINAIYRKQYLFAYFGRVLPIIVVDATKGLSEFSVKEQVEILETCAQKYPDSAFLKILISFVKDNPGCEVYSEQKPPAREDIRSPVDVRRQSSMLLVQALSRKNSQEHIENLRAWSIRDAIVPGHGKSYKAKKEERDHAASEYARMSAATKEVRDGLGQVYGVKSTIMPGSETSNTGFLNIEFSRAHTLHLGPFILYFQDLVAKLKDLPAVDDDLQDCLYRLVLRFIRYHVRQHISLQRGYIDGKIDAALMGDQRKRIDLLRNLLTPYFFSPYKPQAQDSHLKELLDSIKKHIYNPSLRIPKRFISGNIPEAIKENELATLARPAPSEERKNFIRKNLAIQLLNILEIHIDSVVFDFSKVLQEFKSEKLGLDDTYRSIYQGIHSVKEMLYPYDNLMSFFIDKSFDMIHFVDDVAANTPLSQIEPRVKDLLSPYGVILKNARTKKRLSIKIQLYNELLELFSGIADYAASGLSRLSAISADLNVAVAQQKVITECQANLDESDALVTTDLEAIQVYFAETFGKLSKLLESDLLASYSNYTDSIKRIIDQCLLLPHRQQTDYLKSHVDKIKEIINDALPDDRSQNGCQRKPLAPRFFSCLPVSQPRQERGFSIVHKEACAVKVK